MNQPFRFLTEDQILRLQQRQLLPSVILTVVLALRVFYTPIMSTEASWLHTLSQTLVFAALVYMAATTRRHLIVAGVLGFVAIGFEIGQLLFPSLRSLEWLQILQIIVVEILLIYVFWLMIKDLFTAKVVDATTLLLAVNCYLLIGMLWALLYTHVEVEHPGSFIMAGDAGVPVWKHLFYFSFVTLTTLGYGDIQPVAPLARSMAIAESVSGVLFTGILVARLVGMYGASGDES